MIDFSRLNYYPVDNTKSKFHFNRKQETEFDKFIEFYKKTKYTVWMMGAHPVKHGFSKYIRLLIQNGKINLLAMNGATAIHDYEIARFGHTSENVEETIKNGRFGFRKETLHSIRESILNTEHYGESMKRLCSTQKYKRQSILAAAHEYNVPVTVHVAIGTDITHLMLTGKEVEDEAYFESIGRSSGNDFKLFISELYTNLDNTSLVVNVCCNTIMPEVFIKAISAIRNLGNMSDNFYAAVFDREMQYRPMKNVLERPTKNGHYFRMCMDYYMPMIPSMLRITKNVKRI